VSLTRDSFNTETIIARYYERLKNRDRDGLLELLSPDMRVKYYGPEGLLPFIGEFNGIDGFDRFFGIIQDNLDIVEVESLDQIASDTKLVVQARGVWRSKATGRDIRGNMVNVFTVADGRITQYEVYNDTAAFAVGMGLIGD